MLFLVSINVYSQPKNKDWARPSKLTSSAVINAFVTSCFDIYESQKSIVYKLESVRNEILEPVKGSNPAEMWTKFNECLNGFQMIERQAPILIESGAGMIDAARGLSPLEYVRALQNVTTAIKAITYSLSNTTYLLVNAVPDLKKRLSGNTAAQGLTDTTTVNNTAGNAQVIAVQSAPVTMTERKTVLSIKGIKHSVLQNIREALNSCSGVKNVMVKFDQQVSQINILHTGSTEEIWKHLNTKFPTLLTDDNLTSLDEEAGTISLAIK